MSGLNFILATLERLNMSTKDDFTSVGTKVEAQYENDRNAESADLFKAIIREVFGVNDVICGHHLSYERREKRQDGFIYTFVQEIPSADALIFDHDIARKLWGEANYIPVLVRLAQQPIAGRDALLGRMLAARVSGPGSPPDWTNRTWENAS